MRLTEIFHSIQGEGILIGIPMLFVRTNRCNLRCKWCDSTYTFTGGTETSLGEIMEQVKSSPEEWICLTGGEPLLQKESPQFIREAGDLGKRVLVETSGSLPVDEIVKLTNSMIDMDIKTPSSGEEHSLLIGNLDLLRSDDYLKFVISDQKDYDYSVEFLKKHKGRIRFGVVFQPAWGTDLKWLVEEALKDKLAVRVLPQLHKMVWGEIPGV